MWMIFLILQSEKNCRFPFSDPFFFDWKIFLEAYLPPAVLPNKQRDKDKKTKNRKTQTGANTETSKQILKKLEANIPRFSFWFTYQ